MAEYSPDLDDFNEEELTSLLGRLEVEDHYRKQLKESIMDALEERSGGFVDFDGCGLCGGPLTNDFDRDTGVCTPCAEVEA